MRSLAWNCCVADHDAASTWPARQCSTRLLSRRLLLARNPEVPQQVSLPLLCLFPAGACASRDGIRALFLTLELGLCRKLDQRFPTGIALALRFLALAQADYLQDLNQAVFIPAVRLLEPFHGHRLQF